MNITTTIIGYLQQYFINSITAWASVNLPLILIIGGVICLILWALHKFELLFGLILIGIGLIMYLHL